MPYGDGNLDREREKSFNSSAAYIDSLFVWNVCSAAYLAADLPSKATAMEKPNSCSVQLDYASSATLEKLMLRRLLDPSHASIAFDEMQALLGWSTLASQVCRDVVAWEDCPQSSPPAVARTLATDLASPFYKAAQ